MATEQSMSWSDLPPELLGLVLKRLPSLADRVRLRAVCHPWRSNALLQSLPPPLPLLALLDGTFLSIPDGEIIEMPVPDPDDVCCYGSIGSWLFLVDCDGKCSLMNPFSEDTLELPELATGWHIRLPGSFEFNPVFCKLAVPSPLEPSLVPLIAIMHESWSLCIFQPPVVADTIQGREPLEALLEITFFGGKLYAIDSSRTLLNIELAESLGHWPKISSFKCIIDSSDDLLSGPEPRSSDEEYIVKPYLVECADLTTKPCRWRRVNDLGGHALFVSSSCSKFFPAEECSGVQENCIYFMNEFSGLRLVADPLHDSGVYNMKTGEIIPLLSETAAVPSNHVGPWHPTWLFPTQAM